MKKGFTQIVIIAAATLLISAVLIFAFLQKNKTSEKPTPSPSPVPQYQTDETVYTETTESANWKTYTNSKYGFEIKHPSEWFTQEEFQGANTVGFIEDQDLLARDTTSLKGSRVIVIHVSNRPLSELIEAIKRECTYTVNNQVMYDVVTEQKEVAGIEATRARCKFPEQVSPDSIWLFVPYKASFFEITFAVYNQDPPQLLSQELVTSFDQILSTFKFLDDRDTQIISQDKTSPDGSFAVSEETAGDYNKITIRDQKDTVIVEDLIAKNEESIGYGIKFTCQCGTYFNGWVNNSSFVIKIINALGEEYEFLVDARTGMVNKTTFKRIK